MNVALAIVGSVLIAATAIAAAQEVSILKRRGPVWPALASRAGHSFRLATVLMLFGLSMVLAGARAPDAVRWVVVSVAIAVIVYDGAVWLRARIRRAPAR